MRLRFDVAGLVLAVAMLCGVAARGGSAVAEFSGTDSYIALGAPASLYLGTNQPFTVEGWMYLRSVESVNMLLSKNEEKIWTSDSLYMGCYEFVSAGTILMIR